MAGGGEIGLSVVSLQYSEHEGGGQHIPAGRPTPAQKRRFLVAAALHTNPPPMVTWRVGDADYEVVHSVRGGATQIYHLNLLKACREVTPDSLTTTVIETDELGPEVANSNWSAPVHVDDYLSPSHILCPARAHLPHTPPHRNTPRCGSAFTTLSAARTQE